MEDLGNVLLIISDNCGAGRRILCGSEVGDLATASVLSDMEESKLSHTPFEAMFALLKQTVSTIPAQAGTRQTYCDSSSGLTWTL